MRTTDPLPAQLAGLDHASVLRLIQILTASLNMGGSVGKRFGAWAWALLARVREVGECGSEEVGILRDLGKRAAWVLKRFRESREGHENGEVEEAVDVEVEERIDVEDDIDEGELVSDVVEEHEQVQVDDDALPAELRHIDLELPLVPPARALTQASLPMEPDYPATDSEHIDVLNEVTKSVNSPLRADNTQEGLDDHEARELAAAKLRVRAQLDVIEKEGMLDAESLHRDSAKDRSGEDGQDITLATLDMILTVVGEFYGQRDLLELRDLWDEGL